MKTSALRVKICGIMDPAQGRAIAQMGATALGFICAPRSPRYVTPEQIAGIVAALPPRATGEIWSGDRIGVFVDADMATMIHTATVGQLSGIQLHGQESPDLCQQLRHQLPTVELIKALRIRTADDLALAQTFEPWVDALLLDAYDPALAGGTGKTLDWRSLQHFRPRCPWLLAGGLTPENVLTALATVQPDGIDLSSGVERSPGNKDLVRVQRLFDQLQLTHAPRELR